MYNGYHAPNDCFGQALSPMEYAAYFESGGQYNMRPNHFIENAEMIESKLHVYWLVKQEKILVKRINIGDTVVVMYKDCLTKVVIHETLDDDVSATVVDFNGSIWLVDYPVENCFKVKDGKKSRCEYIKGLK